MAVQDSLKDRTVHRLKEPSRYHVVMHNDDFTTMDFVVEILQDIFHKSGAEAEALMMKVHNQGRAVIGTYSYDIASTKVSEATTRARAEGFPFRVTLEEE